MKNKIVRYTIISIPYVFEISVFYVLKNLIRAFKAPREENYSMFIHKQGSNNNDVDRKGWIGLILELLIITQIAKHVV